MSKVLSKRVQSIKPSPTLAVTAKAAELRAAGRDVIGLGAGEPDFDTPAFIQAAASDAMRAGFTRYTPVGGLPSVKAAICAKFAKENQLNYKPEQVMVSCGAKQCIYNLAQAMLDPGDEVIILAPYWVSYPDIVLLTEAKPVIVNAGIEQRFKVTPEQLEQAITPKTKLVFLNSPSNPTGMAYTRAELQALGEVLKAHPDIWIMSDDIYEHVLWAAEPFANIVMACPELSARTLVINGVSKGYAMTGWRIGYCAGDADVIKAMTKIQGQSTSNPCAISQKATEAALQGDQSFMQTMLQAFKERHDWVVNALNEIPGVNCLAADGTFYAFFAVQALIDKLKEVNDDTALAEFLIQQAEIALVPGSAFGAPGYLRLSFATDLKSLQTALQRFKQAVL